jgi:hypothetical protein
LQYIIVKTLNKGDKYDDEQEEYNDDDDDDNNNNNNNNITASIKPIVMLKKIKLLS